MGDWKTIIYEFILSNNTSEITNIIASIIYHDKTI
jgi:hypothetical protein